MSEEEEYYEMTEAFLNPDHPLYEELNEEEQEQKPKRHTATPSEKQNKAPQSSGCMISLTILVATIIFASLLI